MQRIRVSNVGVWSIPCFLQRVKVFLIYASFRIKAKNDIYRETSLVQKTLLHWVKIANKGEVVSF